MTQDEIIRMAREAGFDVDEGLFPFEATEDKYIGTSYNLERFATLVAAHERNRHAWTQEHWTEYEHAIAAAEREACAKVCERLISGDGLCADDGVWIHDCAAVIRNRGAK